MIPISIFNARIAMSSSTPSGAVSFKDTLNLPRTEFPIRAQSSVFDPQMLERWAKEDLSYATFTNNSGRETFILHDGPPYANGNIHIGHAYNKILKDMVTKSQRMMGKHVPVTPGWDCHGLPIELKVSKENPGLDRVALKKACRAYAQTWIDTQREEFKKLGVLMDWDHPYLTMSHEYEAAIVRSFGIFVKKGYIARKNKTVPWCASCETVLATAEIEYEDRKDPSVYVLFPIEERIVDALVPSLSGHEVSVLIWTTTPWTLPLNRAVMMKPGASYVVMRIEDRYIITGKDVAEKVAALVNATPEIITEFVAEDIITMQGKAYHPFIDGLLVPFVLHEGVDTQDGTAFVHCAPGCGPEDYEVGIKYGLDIFSPVSTSGVYTKEIAPQELEGMKVQDGQIWVIKKLSELHRLFYKTNIKHSYPHCWRCHNGLIFRATKQWFCDLSQDGLKERALQATKHIQTVPDKSINRLQATIEGRLEWCLSRQRVWGVPIPALLCTTCDYTYSSPGFIDMVAAAVEKEGIEYWDRATIEELGAADISCPKCPSSALIKETDILDVWFDSGVSHYAVLQAHNGLQFPANVYLEGKDQHRGWFQSSLLTSLVINDCAPMKTIVTHGFTVDDKGRKMSKSLGNVVSPQEMIEKLGTDGLRLWASSIDISGEAVVSPVLIQNVQEVFRKVRNTCRFLLSNLYDFDSEKDAVSLDQLLPIDAYALEQAFERNYEMIRWYNAYDFTAIFHALGDYCAVDLSSFYLDIIKDRLYVEKANGHERRSAQTACFYILDMLTRTMAPILSFTSEQLSDLYEKNKTHSIHLQMFTPLADVWHMCAQKYGLAYTYAALQLKAHTDAYAQLRALVSHDEMRAGKSAQWEALKALRTMVLKELEVLRAQGTIKHSLEAAVSIALDAEIQKKLQRLEKDLVASHQTMEDFFKEFFIVSQVHVTHNSEHAIRVLAEHAAGNKCPRCWRWDTTQDTDHLCARCMKIVR